MAKQQINTDKAPKAIGPYSQAISVDGFVFCSGQIPINPKTGELVGNTIEEQTHQVMRNLKAVLEAAGVNFSHVVKTTIFLKDLNDFSVVNEIYSSYLIPPYPARSTVQVAQLPKDVRVEIECIAKI